MTQHLSNIPKALYYYNRFCHYSRVCDLHQARSNLISSIRESPLPLSVYHLAKTELSNNSKGALSLLVAYYPLASEKFKREWLDTFLSQTLDHLDAKVLESGLLSVSNTVRRKFLNPYKKVSVCILSAAWKREELLDAFIEHYKRISLISNLVELSFIFAVSPGDGSRDVCNHHNIPYVECPNTPLSHKWQAALDAYSKSYEDFMLILGSDDFISQSLLEKLVLKSMEGYPVIGLRAMAILHTDKILTWPGYDLTNQPLRYGESIGAGRIISRDFLVHLGYKIWGEKVLNKGLDSMVSNAFVQLGSPILYSDDLTIPLLKDRLCTTVAQLSLGSTNHFHYVLDVKQSEVASNVTPFESFSNLPNSSIATASLDDVDKIVLSLPTSERLINIASR